MAFPLMAAAESLVTLAPALFKWLTPGGSQEKNGHNPCEVAFKIVEAAQKITGLKDPTMVFDRLKREAPLLIKFQETMRNLHKELMQAEIADRENARHRDIRLLELGRSNLRADIMVVAAALGLIACLVCLVVFQWNLPGEAVGIISTVAGIFGACLKDAYAFEFGSSRGSKDKDLKKFLKELEENRVF